MGALQYATVDVSSDYSYHRMTYYTHYMGTETPVCVCASDSWMQYEEQMTSYTCHMCTDSLQHVLSAVQLEYSDKKT